jgi:hypothetical protein
MALPARIAHGVAMAAGREKGRKALEGEGEGEEREKVGRRGVAIGC